jgi:hypothetical protein
MESPMNTIRPDDGAGSDRFAARYRQRPKKSAGSGWICPHGLSTMPTRTAIVGDDAAIGHAGNNIAAAATIRDAFFTNAAFHGR